MTTNNHRSSMPVPALLALLWCVAPVRAQTGNTTNGPGYAELASVTTGSYNTASGFQALQEDTTGSYNTALGYLSLAYGTNGGTSTAVGIFALSVNNGGYNTAFGNFALDNTTNSSYNTATGFQALYYSGNLSYYAGNLNTASGYQSLASLEDGSDSGANYDTAEGYQALQDLNDGEYNVALGYFAGQAPTTGTNNLYIANASSSGNESGVIRIGNSARTMAFIQGIYSNTVSSGANVYVDSSGHLGTVSSSAKVKRQVRDMGKESDVLLSMRPVTFQYKTELDRKGRAQFGLIAEEVEKTAPGLVLRDARGDLYSVRYNAVDAMLLNEFQNQARAMDAQAMELKGNLGDIEAAGSDLAAVKRDIDRLGEMQIRLKRLDAATRQLGSEASSKNGGTIGQTP